MKRVSIIMITYNHEHFFEKAIQSILNQKVDFDYEIIIGDDASQDRTADLIKEYQRGYPELIKFIERKKNIGVTKNLYDLILRAKGEYIAYLEGDDYWIDKNKLKNQVNFLEKNKSLIGVAHAHLRVNNNDVIVGKVQFSKKIVTINMSHLLDTNGLFHTATLVHRNFFHDKSICPEIIATANPLIGDFTIACLCLDNGNILYLPDYLSAYRDDRSSDVRSEFRASRAILKMPAENYEKIYIMYDRLEKYFNNKYNFDKCRIIRYEEVLKLFVLKKLNINEFYTISRNLKFKIKAFAFGDLLGKYLKLKK